MSTVNEQLADAAVSHSVDLEQYKTGVVRRMIALLNRADGELAAALQAALERLPAASFTVERLELLLGEVRRINAQAYQAIGRELTEELRQFADQEALYHGGLFAATLPEAVPFVRITGAQVFAAAYAQPFRGRLLSEWAQSIEADRMTRIRDNVRLGIVEQQTTQQIVQRIRGTRAKGYSDGIIEVDRRNATAIVRTAVSHIAERTRDRFYDENDDLVKGIRWSATLDTRTTPICQVRDGKLYTVGAHKPIDHQLPWLGGPGRAHWACRSASVPLVKSWRELGIDIDEATPTTRASLDGQVPAEQTYGQWLVKQSAARQDQIVGPTRAKLMREGKLPFDALYTSRGEYLTLDQLAERNASAFKRALGP